MSRLLAAALAAAILVAPVRAQEKSGKGPAPQQFGEKTGFPPLCDMTANDKYKGEEGGLYGGGKNEPPREHADAARAEASKIQPVDGEGKPAADGKVVLLSIGMSNTTQEFSRFLQLARGTAKLTIVDGAQGGQAAIQWDTPEAKPWDMAENRLRQAGATAKQVQVVWIKQALLRQGQHGGVRAPAKKTQGGA